MDGRTFEGRKAAGLPKALCYTTPVSNHAKGKLIELKNRFGFRQGDFVLAGLLMLESCSESQLLDWINTARTIDRI